MARKSYCETVTQAGKCGKVRWTTACCEGTHGSQHGTSACRLARCQQCRTPQVHVSKRTLTSRMRRLFVQHLAVPIINSPTQDSVGFSRGPRRRTLDSKHQQSLGRSSSENHCCSLVRRSRVSLVAWASLPKSLSAVSQTAKPWAPVGWAFAACSPVLWAFQGAGSRPRR